MTRKVVKALVKPEILVWAREDAGFELDDLAADSGLSNLPKWEAGELQPTINQLRILARKYKRPLAVFYLSQKPKSFRAITDFRCPSGKGMQRISPDLHLQVRTAQERRTIALELLQAAEDDPPDFPISAGLDDDPERAGIEVRRFLSLSDDEQRAWGDQRKAFNRWRELIEEKGCLVFQMDKVNTKEASGFALAYTTLPVIAVNRADTPARRSLSLLHEFAHLLLSKSGVSEFHIDTHLLPPKMQKIEIWCNAVAAAALIPQAMFLNDERVRDRKQGDTIWSDADIEGLASLFCVSRIAILRRLSMLGLTDRSFYNIKEGEYAQDYAEASGRKKASSMNRQFGGRNLPAEALDRLGRGFVRMVLASYHSDRITLRDVSDYLNSKTDHIPAIERMLLGNRAR
ncbi:MAG: ImmA/IrrE family metallo-endopeptidase [Ectothiorhodospiraceae bacterium AqS1]|nr:ImmA/IrrE family metallo-endopeptidase [Ectothiorhodospiraceae bacterium AqS1]